MIIFTVQNVFSAFIQGFSWLTFFFFWGAFCRYASLYFCMCIDEDDNELEVLEIIHHFVEILDRYFGSVRPELKLCSFVITFPCNII